MRKKSKPATSLPLANVRVLVGRAHHQASALSSELRQLGADVIEIPFIEIRSPRSFGPLDSALRDLNGYDWLILTSVNGVEAMWDRLTRRNAGRKRTGILAAAGPHLRIAAIGPATKKAIEQRGMKVNVLPKEYIAESVVRSLKHKVKGKRVLLVRAKVARDVIPRELRKAGAHVDVVEAYETVVPKSSRARLRAAFTDPKKRPHIIAFTSSSTVRNFVQLSRGSRSGAQAMRGAGGHENPFYTIRLASIGPVTSSTLKAMGLHADIEAAKYTIPGLVRAIVEAVRT